MGQPMEAWLLGSGGWIPTDRRETTCVLVRAGARALVVDLGTGARRLVTEPELLAGVDQVDVVLSHVHPDHVCGLAYLPALPVRATVWAPGAWLYDTPSTELLAGFLAPPMSPFSPDHLPRIRELEAGETEVGGFALTTRAQPRHRATTVGFRIGDSLAVVTDTAYDEGTEELARGVDHLLHDAWSDGEESGHSSGSDAGRVAAAAQVRRLTLIHLSPLLASHDEVLAQARREFPAARLGEDGAELLGSS